MFIEHERTSGGYISGETKLGMILCLLTDGDSYDLGVIFDISSKSCDQISYEVLKNWIIDSKIGEINMKDYLNDLSDMEEVSKGFSKRFNGILIGATCALDGWLVRISKPTMHKDSKPNPTSFYPRKRFYALNDQVIVDHRKKVRWVSYSNKDALHDCSCFRNTYFYSKILKEKEECLYRHKLYILGDSVYLVESFTMTPYIQVVSHTVEDAFSFLPLMCADNS